MSRSVWKGPFLDAYVIKKVRKFQSFDLQQKGSIKIYSRRSTIIPEFVGLRFDVHNGRGFVSVLVVEDMVGRKFGEFSPTRKFLGHSGDKKVKKK